MTSPAADAIGDPVYWLTRADDQLDIRVRPDAMTVQPDGAGGHVLKAGVAGGHLVVTTPSQHVLETANTVETQGQTPVFPRESTLVFEAPKTTPPIPLTIDGILAALPTLALAVDSVAGHAQPLPAPAAPTPAGAVLAASAEARRADEAARDAAHEAARRSGGTGGTGGTGSTGGSGDAAATPRPSPITAERERRAAARLRPAAAADAAAPPGATFTQNTSLRLPSRLELTPRGGAMVFAHAAEPVTRDGRTELWHTRLETLREDGSRTDAPAHLIALSTRELPANANAAWAARVGDARLAGALTRTVREGLVAQTPTRPLVAEQLMLSAYGAWLDAERDFSASDPLKSYRHYMVMGRDLLTRSVLRGKLYPFGHDAMLTTTTRRRFDPDNGQLAKLVTTQVVSVRQPLRTFNGNNPQERAMPWRTVRLLTTLTPGGTANGIAPGATMLHVDGTAFRYHLVGVDRAGRTQAFRLPLVFLEEGKDLGPVATAYRDLHPAFRTAALGGQTIAVAEPVATAPEATDVAAAELVLTMAGDAHRVTTEAITGALPSLQRFVPALADTTLALTYATAFTTSGFGSANAGQLVLQLAAGQAVKLLDMADATVTGGLATPSFSMNAVSRLSGPVGGDLVALAKGKVTVAELLKKTIGDVRLLGVFSLVDLVGGQVELLIGGADPARRVPELITEAIDGVSMPRFHWETALFQAPGMGPGHSVAAKQDSVDVGPVTGTLSAIDGKAKLVLDVRTELVEPFDPADPLAPPKVRTTALARVENVRLTMGAFGQQLVVVPFKSISFTTVDGRKPDVDADLGDLEFHGVLAFVRALAALIPGDAFHDPPALDVTDEKIRSSVSLPVPSLAIGMFSLENITFGAALDLWFAKPPELSLDFATFDNRFRLTVLCLGGGGYLGARLSTRGLEALDGALEFGASLSVNLGIARGAVSTMGGVHFAYDRDTGPVLSGYLEVRGEVEVLCLVEVGVSLLVSLTYHVDTGELSGKAMLEAHVKVLFFKKTVRVPFSYTFIGGDEPGGSADERAPRAVGAAPAGMPGFAAVMSPAAWPAGEPRPWDAYCRAFA